MIHDMRHCCASWLMMNGADLNDDVRQILGHKSIAMTLRYATFRGDNFAKFLPNAGRNSKQLSGSFGK
jgi:integrase